MVQRDPEALADALVDADPLRVGETGDDVPESEGERLALPDGDRDGVTDSEPVADCEPVAVSDGVRLRLCVSDGVSDRVPERV